MNNTEKIMNLVVNTKDMTVSEAIKYIEELFPADKYKWDQTSQNDALYIDNRDVIMLSDPSLSKLIIDYPGGDRFGSSLSDPFTDIYFTDYDNKYKSSNIDMFLFKENQYNSNNQIMNYIEAITNEELSVQQILDYISTMELTEADMKFLDNLSDDILIDKKIIDGIAERVESIAFYRQSAAYDQFQYGHNGGEDVADWELSLSTQYEILWKDLPPRVREYCNDKMEQIWLGYSETQKELNQRSHYLQKELENTEILEKNIHSYIEDVNRRYDIFEKYADYLASTDKDGLEVDWRSMEYLYQIAHGQRWLDDESFFKHDIHNVWNHYMKEMISEEQKMKETLKKYIDKIDELENQHFYFWQSKKKEEVQKIIKNLKVNYTVDELQYTNNIKNISNKLDKGIDFEFEINELSRMNDLSGMPSLAELIPDIEHKDIAATPKEEYISTLLQEMEIMTKEKESVKHELDATNALILKSQQSNHENQSDLTSTLLTDDQLINDDPQEENDMEL